MLGYEYSHCIVKENSESLIAEMVEYINKISQVNQDNLEQTYQHIIDQLNELVDYYLNNESEQNISKKSHKGKIMSHFCKCILSIKTSTICCTDTGYRF